jgi:malonate-semialdehyde dehydrogenase (acetylating)/methylmalonate-semialdehyde dehydrogenase
MAISVVVAVEPVADELIAKLTERMAKLVVGDGRRSCDMGPLVTEVHRDKVAGYIDIAAKDGATVVVDGRGIEVDGDPNGFWLGPTLLDRVPTTSKAYTEEIFGPVLSIVRVASYDEGVDLINSGAFGNGTAIFTRDGGAARQFQFEVQVGMVGINVPIPVPVSYYSFGGWKASLFGDTHMYGPEGINFYTRTKVITSRWPDPAKSTVDLGFPQNR